MIEEYGIVEERTPDRIGVRIVAPGGCDACPVKGNCYGEGQLLTIPIDRIHGCDPDSLQTSDRIRFTVERVSLLALTGLVYGIPLLALLAGTLFGYFGLFPAAAEQPRALFSFFTGAGALLLVAASLRHFDRRRSGSPVYRIRKAVTPAAGPSGRLPT